MSVPCTTCNGTADPENGTYCATCCPAPPPGGQPARDYIDKLEAALDARGERLIASREREREMRQQRDDLRDAITAHRKGKLYGIDTSDELDEALWTVRDRILKAARSEDLDEFGQIGNSTPEADSVTSAGGSQGDDAMHLSIDRRMGESCPTCGSAVRVVSGDESTSHYEPA